MLRDISHFKGIHAGADIWVVGSGSSLDYVAPDFFDNKIAVGLNSASRKFKGLKYTCCHHYEEIKINALAGIPTIVPRHDQGFPQFISIEEWVALKPYLQGVDNLFYFEHEARGNSYPRSIDPPDEDKMLSIGTSVSTEGMSFAKYLGAKTIILCGIDCGEIDGCYNFDGYEQMKSTYSVFAGEQKMMAAFLRSKGVAVHSLNPFINLGLEGHKFTGG